MHKRSWSARLTGGAVSVLAMAAFLSGCGGSSPRAKSPSPTSTVGRQAKTASGTTGAAGEAGCGLSCEQASPPGSAVPHAAPAPGSLVCPAAGCVEVLSTRAMVRAGAVTVSMRCVAAQACQGEVLMYAAQGGEGLGEGALDIPAGTTDNVSVSVSPQGQQLADTSAGVAGSLTVSVAGSSGPVTPAPLLTIYA